MTQDQAFELLEKVDGWYFHLYQNIYGYADGFFITLIKLGSESIRLYIESDGDDYTGFSMYSVEYPNTSDEYRILNKIMKSRYAEVGCGKEYREGLISFARKEKINNFRHGGRPVKKSSCCRGNTTYSYSEWISTGVIIIIILIFTILITATQ